MVKWRRMAGISNTWVSFRGVWKQSLMKTATLSPRVWTILEGIAGWVKTSNMVKPATNLRFTESRLPDHLGKGSLSLVTEITSTPCPKLVFWTGSLMCWPYVNLGPKGMDSLGFFNYLLVSESCCVAATWLPTPDCSKEFTIDEKQKSRKDPQALAVASLENTPYEPEEEMLKGAGPGEGGMIFQATHFIETIIVQRPFQKNTNHSPDDVSHRTCVSKRLVVGGGGRVRQWTVKQ